MRRLSRVSIVTVFAIALTQMAMAADLPPAYTPPLPPVFSWTGFYVGGNAGWGWLRDSGGTFCINPAGILNGPGCNAQTATAIKSAAMDSFVVLRPVTIGRLIIGCLALRRIFRVPLLKAR